MRLSNGTEQKAGPGRGLGWNFQCQLPNPFAHFLISLSRRVLTTGLLQLATGLIFSICGFSGLQGEAQRMRGILLGRRQQPPPLPLFPAAKRSAALANLLFARLCRFLPASPILRLLLLALLALVPPAFLLFLWLSL